MVLFTEYFLTLGVSDEMTELLEWSHVDPDEEIALDVDSSDD